MNMNTSVTLSGGSFGVLRIVAFLAAFTVGTIAYFFIVSLIIVWLTETLDHFKSSLTDYVHSAAELMAPSMGLALFLAMAFVYIIVAYIVWQSLFGIEDGTEE